jgi:hypothetical protein
MKKASVIRVAVLLVIGAGVLVGAVVYRGQRSAAMAANIRQPASELVKSADIYKTEAALVDQYFEVAHPEAIAAVGSGFTTDGYYTALFQSMVNQAKAAGRDDVGRSLRIFAVGKGYLEVKF